MHWRNAFEREIKTFKNRFITELCIVNPDFPLQLWNIFLYQATSTLNMMQKSIKTPNIYAHEKLFVISNFNHTPFALPGTRILVHDKPEKRSTYAPHRSYGWCIVGAPLQYRCFTCYMASTKLDRTSNTVDLSPHHFDMSKTSSSDAAAISEPQLIHALENPTPESQFKTEEPE